MLASFQPRMTQVHPSYSYFSVTHFFATHLNGDGKLLLYKCNMRVPEGTLKFIRITVVHLANSFVGIPLA